MLKEGQVIAKNYIAKDVYEFVIEVNLKNVEIKPGQFVHVRVSESTEHMLRRPISISSVDKNNNTITLVFRTGDQTSGTKKISYLDVGNSIDLLLPLGNGYDIDDVRAGSSVLLIGGGIGVPPLYELAKRLRDQGVKTTHVLGFNSEEDVFYEEKFRALGETHIATADGSYGHQGFVTDVIKAIGEDFDKFYACGPKVMLKVLDESLTIDGFISLEERMGCGIGVCYACVCQSKDQGQLKICTDGPVFKKGAIVL